MRKIVILAVLLCACGGGGGSSGSDADNDSGSASLSTYTGHWIGIGDIVQNSCNLPTDSTLVFAHDVTQDGNNIAVQMSSGQSLAGSVDSEINGFEANSEWETDSGCTSRFELSYIQVQGDTASTALICAHSICSTVDCLTCWAGEANRH